MIRNTYAQRVRFSEQESSDSPRNRFLEQLLKRDQVQSAIGKLLRAYEVESGFTVTQLAYDRADGSIAIEALPL